MIKLIKTEKEYESALAQLDGLMELEPEKGTEDFDKMELLIHLISKYEDQNFPIDLPDPIEAIKFRMEQQSLTQKDLVPYIGNPSKVSEVLNKKRPLSLNMIRSLHKGLGIPAEILLQEKDEKMLENPTDLDFNKFPLNEIYKCGWLKNFSGSLTELKQNAEEILRKYFLPEDIELTPLFRKSNRLKSNDDKYALFSWTIAVKNEGEEQHLHSTFKKENITKTFLEDIVKLSYLDNGPKLAVEYLNKKGIHFVHHPHLSKTHIDGAIIKLKNDTPLIALTLRYDRLDNFWFTLCHELAHLYLHFNDPGNFIFLDDLEINDNLEQKEKEADRLAEEILIPSNYWKKIIAENGIPAKEDIVDFADKLRIHPAIIAGRIRRTKANYRLYSNLVGQGKVRKLFD